MQKKLINNTEHKKIIKSIKKNLKNSEKSRINSIKNHYWIHKLYFPYLTASNLIKEYPNLITTELVLPSLLKMNNEYEMKKIISTCSKNIQEDIFLFLTEKNIEAPSDKISNLLRMYPNLPSILSTYKNIDIATLETLSSYQLDNEESNLAILKRKDCTATIACNVLARIGIDTRIPGKTKEVEVLIDTISHPWTGGNFHDSYVEEIYETRQIPIEEDTWILNKELINILNKKNKQLKKEIIQKIKKTKPQLAERLSALINT